MFVQGGNGQGIPADFLQQLFQGGGGNVFMGGGPGQWQQPQQQQQQAPLQKPNTAPTANATFRALPRIKVTVHDIAANEESNECSICLDELQIGQPALRIPCGHLYHEECVKDWLRKSNECPVCRYELPTDNAEFERGRRERMAGRRIRMRRTELTVKTAQELRHFASFLCVDVVGCLEKSEFVDRILASSKVEIIPSEGDDEPMWTPLSAPPPELTRCPAAMQAEASANVTSCGVDVSDLRAKSVGDLRKVARALGVSLDGCLEKADIVERIRASPNFPREG